MQTVGIVAVVDGQDSFPNLTGVTDLDPEAEARLALAKGDLGRDLDRASTAQVRESTGDFLFDLRLARTAFGSLPAQCKWLVGGRGARGSDDEDPGRPERS